MTLIDLIILALATYRISLLISQEDGPGNILSWFRWKIGVEINKQGTFYGNNNFAEGVLCQWCNSIWIGLAFTIAYLFFPAIVVYVGLPFALSAMTVTIKRYIDG